MKKSEKIGIVVVVILAIILVGILINENKNRPNPKDSCSKICISGPQNWLLLGASPDRNSFPTKEECISACLLKKFK